MTFEILFHTAARDEAKDAARYIREEGGEAAAERWLDGLIEKIGSLREHPHRCGYAREHEHGGEDELRQLLYGSHRVIYTVIGERVHILRVRHQRQNELNDV